MKKYFAAVILGLLAAVCGLPCSAQDETVDITRFEVEGNTLLSPDQIQALLTPLTGPKKVYGDIQRALEALENAYRQAGYGAVQVYVPEQELSRGVVRMQVTESVIEQILVSGNEHFDTANVLTSLPALKVGTTPNMRAMSENLRLLNENPAKQVEVTLGMAEQDGKLDAKVKVTDRAPGRFSLTLDNTGTEATGKWRTGISYQHANLFDKDHVGSIAYTSSPDSPSGVKVDIYSLGYRLPLYGLGDSIDVIYGNSSVNTPSVSPTLSTPLGIIGKGDVVGLRYNHFRPRQGEYAAKVVLGIDNKFIDSQCTGNVPTNPAPYNSLPSYCLQHTLRPVSLSYSAQIQGVGVLVDYNVGWSQNLPTGSAVTNNGLTDRYSYFTSGGRPTRDDFSVLRMSASYFRAWASDWQARAAATVQYADTPLPAAEQFGMAGASAVRGFAERAVSADGGALVNLEVYTPDLSKPMAWPGSLRLVLFYDAAQGYNRNADQINIQGAVVPASTSTASSGLGVRYSLNKDLSLRADYARVIDAGTATEKPGDWRAHLNMMLSF